MFLLVKAASTLIGNACTTASKSMFTPTSDVQIRILIKTNIALLNELKCDLAFTAATFHVLSHLGTYQFSCLPLLEIRV